MSKTKNAHVVVEDGQPVVTGCIVVTIIMQESTIIAAEVRALFLSFVCHQAPRSAEKEPGTARGGTSPSGR